MVEHLHNGGIANRARLEVLHAVLARHCNCLDLVDWVGHHGLIATSLGLLLHCSRSQIDLVAYKDLDGHITPIALVDPLLHLFETASLVDAEHEKTGCGSVDVLMDILVVALLPRHIEVHDLVLVRIIYIVGCLNM